MDLQKLSKYVNTDTNYKTSIIINNNTYQARPNHFKKNEGFLININPLNDDLSYFVILDIENNAMDTLSHIGNSSIEVFEEFSNLLTVIASEIISINIGHQEVHNDSKILMKSNWHFLKIQLKIQPI